MGWAARLKQQKLNAPWVGPPTGAPIDVSILLHLIAKSVGVPYHMLVKNQKPPNLKGATKFVDDEGTDPTYKCGDCGAASRYSDLCVVCGALKGLDMPGAPQPTTAVGLCPACNGPMQWKQNRRTLNWFQGCLDFPTCTGTRDVNGNDSRISPQRQNRQWMMLVASVLRSEDECLTFSYDDLQKAEDYELHLDDIASDRSYILTITKKP